MSDPIFADFDDDFQLDAEAERAWLVQDAGSLRAHARIAHLAAADCIDKYLHVAGLGWHRWDRTRFVQDIEDKMVTGQVMRTIRRLAPDALGDKDLQSDLVKSQTASGIAGVVRLMSTIPRLTAHADQLDADRYLLNTQNGVLDLRELERGVAWQDLTLQPHDPRHRMTQITRGAYEPSAHSDLWASFLDRSLPDTEIRTFLQQVMGLGLIGEQLEHVLPILTGKGRNGKGVFDEAIRHAFGDYAAVAAPTLFNIDRHATADKPNPALLGLRARRLVVMSETAKSAEMDAARIKALTGGDTIKARGVHSKTTLEFQPSHQLALISNYAPQLPADDPAVWARVRLIPWDVVVPAEERIPGLGRKLHASADALLAWALAGLSTYFRDGLIPPSRVSEATEQYKAEQDTVSLFLTDRCEDGCLDQDSASLKVLHADYQRYCRANGVMQEHVLKERDFGRRLGELGFPQAKSGSRSFRQGLRLLPTDEEARLESSRAAVVASLTASHRVATTAPVADPDTASTDPAAVANKEAEAAIERLVSSWMDAADQQYGLADRDHVQAMKAGSPFFHQCNHCLEAADDWLGQAPVPPVFLRRHDNPARQLARLFEGRLRKAGFPGDNETDDTSTTA